MATLAIPRIALILSAVLFSVSSSAQDQSTNNKCWFPDGSAATGDTVCDSNINPSACCGSDSLCLANGLCLKYGVIGRGTCTDSTWQSPLCPQYCLDVKDNGATITACSAAGTFACGYPVDGQADCQNASFQIPLDGFRIALRPDQASSLAGSARVTVDYSKGIQGVTAPTTCPAQATVTTTPGFRFSVSRPGFS